MVANDGRRVRARGAQLLRLRRLVLVVSCLSVITIAACGQFVPQTAHEFTSQTSEHVGCKSFEDEFWDALYRLALSQEKFPSATDIQHAYDHQFKTKFLNGMTESEKAELQGELVDLFRLLTVNTTHTLTIGKRDPDQVVKSLATLEMGDRTTKDKQILQTKIRNQFDRIQALVDKVAISCASPTATPAPEESSAPSDSPIGPQNLLNSWRSSRHPAVYGGLKTIATAYQSCEAGITQEITSETQSVRGISIVGTHPAGTGKVRVISDLQRLLNSHYYLHSYSQPHRSCFAVRHSPLIYDYGGKPYTTVNDAEFDLFRNSGSGSKELGVDCSGYVYMSLATAGLKLKSHGRLKAIGVHGVSARMLQLPERNGLDCLDHARFSSTANLMPGDLIASSGHVVLIEEVGEDPFGLEPIRSIEQCRASSISTRRFNFTILQSSNSKGGIGINRMSAADYFIGGDMTSGMITHAVNACRAKFGDSILSHSQLASVVRHKGTASCSDKAIPLKREECVNECPVPTEFGRDQS